MRGRVVNNPTNVCNHKGVRRSILETEIRNNLCSQVRGMKPPLDTNDIDNQETSSAIIANFTKRHECNSKIR